MITQEESGLTPEEYQALLNATTNGVAQVIAYRENALFEGWKAHSNPIDWGGNEASAVIYNGYLFQVITNPANSSQSKILRTNLTTGEQTELSLTLSPVNSALCKLAMNGNNAPMLYSVETTGVRCWTLNSNGDNPQENTALTDSVVGSLFSTAEYVDPWLIVGNMAFKNGTASASSVNGSNVAANAFDENAATAWAANAAAPGWVRYDLGAGNEKDLVAFRVTTPSMRRWYIDASNNGTTWTEVYNQFKSVDSPLLQTNGSIEGRLNTGGTAYRYYRLNITSTYTGNPAVHEFQAYERLRVSNIKAIIPFQIPAGSSSNAGFAALIEIPSKKVYILARFVLALMGSWSAYRYNRPGQPIAFPYLPTSVSGAINMSEGVIVFTTELPGTYLQKLESGTLKNKYQARQGIIAFKVRPGLYFPAVDNHVDVDVVDVYSSTDYRTRATVQQINGVYYIVAKFASGNEQNQITGYRIYQSKDGVNWSLGRIHNFNLGKLGDDEIVLLQSGDYVYAVNRTSIARAVSTLYFGHAANSTKMDITPYLESYSLSQDGMLQGSMILANDSGIFDNHPVVNANNSVVFRHYAGYVVDGQPKLYQLGQTRMDSIEIEDTLKRKTLRIQTRDSLSMLSDYIVSEEFHYFNELQIGYDTFSDQTGTNYGGLSHFAGTGAFKAENSALIATAQRGAGSYTAGYTTLVQDVWNGSVSAAIRIPSQSVVVDESGLAIRQNPYSPGNRCIVIAYQETSDVIRVKSEGNPFLGTCSAKLNWSTPSATYNYIKAIFNYAALTVLQSTNGKNWTVVFHTILDYSNQLYGNPYEHYVTDSTPNNIGKVGVWAYALNSNNNATAYWKQLMVSKAGRALTVENAMRYLAAKAGIMDFDFRTQYDLQNRYGRVGYLWISYVPTVNTANKTISFSDSFGSLFSGIYQIDMRFYPNLIFSFGVSGDNSADSPVFVIIFTRDANYFPTSGYVVRAGYHPAVYAFSSSNQLSNITNYPLTCASSYPAYYSGSINVTNCTWAQEWHILFYQSNQDNANYYHFAVFHGDTPVLAFSDKTPNKTQNTGIMIGYGVVKDSYGSADGITFKNPRIAELSEYAEICSLDPGETTMSAIQRTIEGRNLKMALRYNDALRVWKPKDSSRVMTIPRAIVTQRQETHRPHLIKNHIRVLGAYVQGEYVDADLVNRYGHRFQEINNPYLMTIYDCYLEAQAAVRRMEEQSIQEQLAVPFRPFLEAEDHVVTPGGDRIVDAYQLEFTPPKINMNLRARKYAYFPLELLEGQRAQASAAALPATAQPFNVWGAQANAAAYPAIHQTMFNLITTTQPSNLIGYWQLGETSGTTANDSSGNNRHGSYSSTYTLNQSGVGDGSPSVQFGGGNVGLSGSALTSFDGAFNRAVGTVFVCVYRLNSGSGNLFYAATSIAAIRMDLSASSTVTADYGGKASVSASVPTNDWFTACMTWNVSAQTLKLYINGSLGNQQTLSEQMTDTIVTAVLQSANNSRLAHLAVWTTELTAEQIAYLSPGALFS